MATSNTTDVVLLTSRKGSFDDPFKHYDLPIKICNNVIPLPERPDKKNHVRIDGYFETYKSPIESNQYLVNYSNGIVTFAESENGKTVTCHFDGTGYIQIPASMVYVHFENNPGLIQSFQDLVDGQQTAIQATANFNAVVSQYLQKSVYDSDNDGIVDNAENAQKLENQSLADLDNRYITSNDLIEVNQSLTDLDDRLDNSESTLNQHLADSAYFAKANGLIGDGTTDDSVAFIALINNIGLAHREIYFSSGTYIIGTNITIPSNIKIILAEGAILSPSNGVTITINGSLDAQITRIFGDTGKIVFDHTKTSLGYAEWWGAVPNNANIDCLSAIKSALEALPVVQLMRGDYFISDTLLINLPHKTLQGVDDYYYDNDQNKATRLVVMSDTADVIKIGYYDHTPASVNDFLKQVKVKNLQVSRDRLLTPPVAGNEMTGCTGIRFKNTLFCYAENVRADEHTTCFLLDGTVRTNLRDCYAFRSFAGNQVAGRNDIFFGFLLNGNASIGLAGGNASTYINRCTTTVGGSPALIDSIGFSLLGKPVDTFIIQCECSSVNTGIEIGGDTSQSGNADVHIINPIIDSFKLHGLYIHDVGGYGAIDVSNGYFAPISGSVTSYGIRVMNSTGMIALTNNQIVSWLNNLGMGIWIENSKGVVCRSNMYLGCTRPIIMFSSSNSVIEDIITNPDQTGMQEAISINGTSNRNKFATVIQGKSGAFPYGIKFNGSTNSYNEINCTGIDSACITGGSANKLVINGSQITTTGLSGNNLVSGIMA